MSAAAHVAASLLGHLVLTAAPGVACSLYAIKRGVRSEPIVLGIALAGSGVCAYLALLFYYATPGVGVAWDILLLLASISVIVWCWRTGELDRSTLAPFAAPTSLWLLGSAFIAFLGFVHGGVSGTEPIPMSSVRFSGQLASDNDIPRYFTEWFAAHGHSGRPPEYPAEWLMSDRPPLQIGYALSQHAFVNTAGGLQYQVLCISLQQLWVVGMWAVLTAAGLSVRTRALAMAAAMISDVAIVNGFYVWPKLLAAAFLLAALALVISPHWRAYRRDNRIAALFAALLALAMLSNGSSIFGAIPLVVLAIFRGVPGPRWIGVGLLVGLLLYGPWIAYQHYGDPPGNRLLKWQLGGVVEVNPEGTVEAITNGYDRAGLSGTLTNKERNFGEMLGLPHGRENFEEAAEDVGNGRFGLAIEAIRQARFYSLVPYFGIFLIAPFAMLLARRRKRAEEEWRFALIGFGFVLVACVIWGLLLFGSTESSTTIHVGSFAVPLLGVCACVAGLHSVFPRLAKAIVAINVAAVAIMYAPSLQPPPGTAYSPIMAVLALASLLALGYVLFGSREPARA
jgi:hypothetical protein